ncbi:MULTISPECIES: TAXI family TRAP transporter solute-binding subunit [unclassified Streptomyces]|uniref:TAXI family TRAP transporter solute-binding subunit n=1 Tax=unclassified Streptomyces TaxID=2593676 RepID=UPI001E4D7804|nr:TAXI family TRAP transporter solute-binding subunit [Streptomyces sp. MBT42]MCD2463994.1 TAXI family TRAP transporter solute-binding subunit [Streptomyces sp. MBT42]
MFASLSRAARRRVLAGATALLAVCGVLVWWLMPFGSPVPSGSVTFSTGVSTGVYQRYGDLLKQDLSEDLPEVSITLKESEGSQQNVQRVATGEADFTVATADAVAQYQRERRPGWERLRGCARLYDDYVQIVVRKGSSLQKVQDLRGLRVGVGQNRSGVRLVADRVLAAAGLTPDRDIVPVSAGIDTMPDLLERGELDAFFWSGGLPTLPVQTLSERFPVRLLPLDAALVDRLHDVGGSTRHYRSAVIPADAYSKAQDGRQIETLAVANLLVTTDEVDDDLVEGFTRTVIGSRDRIGRKVHPAQLVDLRTAVYTEPLTLHDGARRYYRSVKP